MNVYFVEIAFSLVFFSHKRLL